MHCVIHCSTGPARPSLAIYIAVPVVFVLVFALVTLTVVSIIVLWISSHSRRSTGIAAGMVKELEEKY